MNRRITLLATILMTYSVASAHPGHGDTDGFTVTHFLTEQAHIAVSMAVLITLSSILAWRYRKSISEWLKSLRHA